MFTAMIRRPLVWLLGILALFGAGWLVYEPGRNAPQPIAETADPPEADDREVERTAPEPPATTPPGVAGDDVAQAPAVPSVTPEHLATEVAEADEAARERLASVPPATPEIAAPQPAAAPPAADPEPVVAAVPPALAPKGEVIAPIEPPGAERVPRTAALEQDSTPARAPGADQEPPAAAGERVVDWARLRELAPGASAPSPPNAPQPADQARGAPEEMPVTVARTTPAPDELRAEPGQSAGTGEAAKPAEAARLAPEAEVIEPSAPPGAGAPSAPAIGDAAVERVPAASLVLDTIRRALAALLGGPPEATHPPGQGAATVEEPPAPVAAAKPSLSEEPSAGQPELIRPSFDIIRVERDGRTVVAGRAAPDAEVELRAGDRVIDRVRASRSGEWVATPLEPLQPGGQELSVAARSAGAPAIEAEQVVVVVVPEPLQSQPAAVAVATPPAEPVAVLLPKAGGGGGRILQAPGRLSSDGQLALVVLDYDDSGRTRLIGEALPGVPVRIYVDDPPSAEVLVEPSGQWTAVLEQKLAPGDYTLRLDQLGGEGRPVARLETPFTRVSQPPVAGEAQVDYVIVQPGNSLWRISRRLFGSGFKYVHIYDANQAQIRDPDLIYPGQVFEVPAAAGTAG
jgi:nucleoid-associated protein YgaU